MGFGFLDFHKKALGIGLDPKSLTDPKGYFSTSSGPGAQAATPTPGFDFGKYPELDQENIDRLKSHEFNLTTYGDQLSNGLDTFKTIFKNTSGRDPTAEETNGYLKQSLYGAWNTPGELQYTDFTNLANNYISNNFDIDQIRRDKGKEDAAKHYGSVDQQIQSLLGRAATDQEKEHFGTLIANGSLDSYQFGQFLEQQPEFTEKKDAAFRTGLSGQLAESDKKQFETNILPGIQSLYAQQGRSFDSSGFKNSATQSAQQQNQQRDQFIASLSASQYGGRQNQAYQDYANAVANQNNLANYQTTMQDQRLAAGTQRIYEQQDYNTQRDAYNQYLAKYGKRDMGAQGAIGGAAAGASIGTGIMPGYGTAVGAVAGGLAGYFGSRGGSY